MNPRLFILTGVVLLLLDSVYLTITKTYFSHQIKRIQGSFIKIDMLAAFLCYLFIAFGLNYFILDQNKSIKDAFLLGLTIYAVYELTNKAIFLNWQWFTVFIDTLWGGILFASTTYLVRFLEKSRFIRV